MARIVRKLGNYMTAADIRRVVGNLDSDLISALQQTGGTVADIEAAYNILVENHYTLSIRGPQMIPRVKRIYEILDYAREDIIARRG